MAQPDKPNDGARQRDRLRVAASTFDITPTDAYDMGSGPRRHDVISGVLASEPLEANIVVIRFGDRDEDVLLMVTLDLLYVGSTLRRVVEEAAPRLEPAQILVAASHTHRAPMTANVPSMGIADPEYLADISNRLRREISTLMDSDATVPAGLRVGAAEASHSINRRRRKWFFLAKKPRWNFIANAPNPRGPTDETLTVLELFSKGGASLAYIWNYACHPVSHPDGRRYSSHFPHVVREVLRRSHDSKIPVLFFQGFSGNSRPQPSRHVRKFKEIVRRIFSGPVFDDMSWRSYSTWSKSLASVAESAICNGKEIDASSVKSNRTVVPGAQFADGSRPIVFQSIRIGSQIQLVAMNAEPVVEYARMLRSWELAPWLMCIGCVDDVAGYIPTDVMIAEGGYESDRSRMHFGVGSYVSDYQSQIEGYLRDVTHYGNCADEN